MMGNIVEKKKDRGPGRQATATPSPHTLGFPGQLTGPALLLHTVSADGVTSVPESAPPTPP